MRCRCDGALAILAAVAMAAVAAPDGAEALSDPKIAKLAPTIAKLLQSNAFFRNIHELQVCSDLRVLSPSYERFVFAYQCIRSRAAAVCVA